jgi:hypothetical protein
MNKEELILRIFEINAITSTRLQSTDALRKLSTLELTLKLNDLYTPYILKLHECYYDKKIGKNILKVPGGWLYGNYDSVADRVYDEIFVSSVV